MERQIKSDAVATFPNHDITTDFEHGQWWITCLSCGAQWSVHDLNQHDFDFEQVSQGDGYCEENEKVSS
jgi:hypothetical protein